MPALRSVSAFALCGFQGARDCLQGFGFMGSRRDAEDWVWARIGFFHHVVMKRLWFLDFQKFFKKNNV